MLKNIWIYVLVVGALGAGGWFYYSHQQTTSSQAIAPTPPASQVIAVQPKESDDELNKKRQEGIGSIKNLKPVPIEGGPNKNNAK